MERQRQHHGDGQPQQDHRRTSSRRSTQVVVHGMHRAEQLAGELALADPLLPAVRGEDDVHVPDQRPDDVVGGEVTRREAGDRAALLRARSSTRPPGRSPARRSCRSCRGSSPPGTGTAGRRPRIVRQVQVDASTGPARPRRRHAAARCIRHGVAPRPGLLAKTCSITSSIGGSSMVRSVTACSASSRAATAARRPCGTRSVTRSPSRPDHLAVPRQVGVDRARQVDPDRLVRGEPRRTARDRSPSKRIRPWWMTITRLHSACTSAM